MWVGQSHSMIVSSLLVYDRLEQDMLGELRHVISLGIVSCWHVCDDLMKNVGRWVCFYRRCFQMFLAAEKCP